MSRQWATLAIIYLACAIMLSGTSYFLWDKNDAPLCWALSVSTLVPVLLAFNAWCGFPFKGWVKDFKFNHGDK